MKGSKLPVLIAVSLGVLAPFFTNMDFLSPPASFPEKETVRVRPEPLPDEPVSDIKKTSRDLWSCTCAQVTEKECSKGYIFHSMSEAIEYSIEACGQNCDPACFVKRDGEEEGHPATASAEDEIESTTR